MQKVRVSIGLSIILLVVGGGLYLVFSKNEVVIRKENSGETTTVSDFVLPDSKGNEVRLSDIRAPLKIIHFWASWSPYSKDELLALSDIKKTFGTKVAIIALNRDSFPNDGKTYLEKLNIDDTIIVIYDQNDTYYKDVGGYNMPETVFINIRGDVLTHIRGPMTPDELQRTVSELFEK